jgi:hypothetical protein
MIILLCDVFLSLVWSKAQFEWFHDGQTEGASRRTQHSRAHQTTTNGVGRQMGASLCSRFTNRCNRATLPDDFEYSDDLQRLIDRWKSK